MTDTLASKGAKGVVCESCGQAWSARRAVGSERDDAGWFCNSDCQVAHCRAERDAYRAELVEALESSLKTACGDNSYGEWWSRPGAHYSAARIEAGDRLVELCAWQRMATGSQYRYRKLPTKEGTP